MYLARFLAAFWRPAWRFGKKAQGLAPLSALCGDMEVRVDTRARTLDNIMAAGSPTMKFVNTGDAITPPSLETGFEYAMQEGCRTHQPKPDVCASDAAVGWLLSLSGAYNFLISDFNGISRHFIRMGSILKK